MTKWVTISVPKELADIIGEWAQRKNIPRWMVVAKGVQWWVDVEKKHAKKTEAPTVDKISWYIAKLAMSVGAFKENPTEKNLEWIKKRVEELKERLGINADYLYYVAERYLREKEGEREKELKIELNMALKQVIMDIIWSSLMSEK